MSPPSGYLPAIMVVLDFYLLGLSLLQRILLAVHLVIASLQAMTSHKVEADPGGPVVARTARGVREGIVNGRAVLQMFFTLTRFSRFALNYITGRR